jgi:acetylornithine deacetylase/succinyl-diaminopimelate desuccinylase-like protein
MTGHGDAEHLEAVGALARTLVRIDSRSFLSNVAVADAIEAELTGFAVERLDYETGGVAKRALVARRGGVADGSGSGGLALSGHMDTVPDTGWQADPWSGRIEGGVLHGLGSTDMKGPLAAIIVAARALPDRVPVTLLLTTDEETDKRGAQAIAARSVLVREGRPAAILVAEPTGMRPVRGHRSHIHFNVIATGVQAHSSTGRGRNASWELVEFLADMKALFRRLRADPTLQDPAYDPPFSDFNPVIDNHGAAGQRDRAHGDAADQVPLQRASTRPRWSLRYARRRRAPVSPSPRRARARRRSCRPTIRSSGSVPT